METELENSQRLRAKVSQWEREYSGGERERERGGGKGAFLENV